MLLKCYPQHPHKNPKTGGRNRRITGACWASCLAESADSRLSEWPCLKILEWRATDVNLWPPVLVCIPTHTLVQTHMDINLCILYTKKVERKREVGRFG